MSANMRLQNLPKPSTSPSNLNISVALCHANHYPQKTYSKNLIKKLRRPTLNSPYTNMHTLTCGLTLAPAEAPKESAAAALRIYGYFRGFSYQATFLLNCPAISKSRSPS